MIDYLNIMRDRCNNICLLYQVDVSTDNKSLTEILTKRSTFRLYNTAFFRILPSQLVTRKCHVIADPAHPVAHAPNQLDDQLSLSH